MHALRLLESQFLKGVNLLTAHRRQAGTTPEQQQQPQPLIHPCERTWGGRRVRCRKGMAQATSAQIRLPVMTGEAA
jgi:hypothetical protein